MKRIYQVLMVFYMGFIIFMLIEANNMQNPHRQKRYLGFKNRSKFYMRLNFRANMVPWTQIFAQAVGFRMNWDEPPDSFHPYRHLSRRDVYNNIEILLNRNDLDGFHCVRRATCEMGQMNQPQGIYLKILKMIFRRHSSSTDRWHKYTEEDCQISISKCPLSLLDILPYTDI